MSQSPEAQKASHNRYRLKQLCLTGTESQSNCFCWDQKILETSLRRALKYDLHLVEIGSNPDRSYISQSIILPWRYLNKVWTLLDTSFYQRIMHSESIEWCLMYVQEKIEGGVENRELSKTWFYINYDHGYLNITVLF